jgi:amino acid transporter
MPQTPPPPAPNSGSHGLHRSLSLFDLVLTQILFVVGSGWVGFAALLGRAQAVYWITAMAIFYLPMAASVVLLNREMPLEGGLYSWARIAFGDFPGFLVAWNIWVYSLGVAAVILFSLPSEIGYLLGPSGAHLAQNPLQSNLILLTVLALLTLASLFGLEFGKWFHNLGGAAIVCVFALLILLPLVALLRHQPIHWEPLPLALPTLSRHAFATVGLMMIGGLAGLEYIAILAGETQAPARTIGRSVQLASPIICLLFILGTSSVLAFAHGAVNIIAPIPQTFRLALGNSGWGNLLAIAAIAALQLRLIGTASLVLTGASRLALTAGWNHLLPRWFTRIHPRRKTPANAILFTSLLVLAILLAASFNSRIQEAFQLMIVASVAHYALAYMAMFAIPLLASATLRQRFPRWLRFTSAVGFASTFFSLIVSIFPVVPVPSPLAYAAKIILFTAASNLAATAFYTLRARARSPLLKAQPMP